MIRGSSQNFAGCSRSTNVSQAGLGGRLDGLVSVTAAKLNV
jgi:hypothetical protein